MNLMRFLKRMARAASTVVSRQSAGVKNPGAQTFTYKTVGRGALKLDAFDLDPNARKPAIVHFHGGRLKYGHRERPWWLNTKSDYALISIDYRLAPKSKLPEIIEDVQDAFRWIRTTGAELLGINADKLAVAGDSAGGYLTLMSGFCVEPRPKALISLSGYAGVVGLWSSLFPPMAENFRRKFGDYWRQHKLWLKEISGHDPDFEAPWFDLYRPIQNISFQYPPTVLIHGTEDGEVPYAESAGMDEALTKFDVPHKFITVPGGAHVLRGLTEVETTCITDKALAFVKPYLS